MPSASFGSWSVSPDGRQFAFRQDGALKIRPVEGGQAREIVTGKLRGRFEWTPSGETFVYVGGEHGDGLWSVSTRGGTPQKLDVGDTMSLFSHVRVHPSGRKIAFSAAASRRTYEVWVMENFLPARESATLVK